MFSQLLTDLVLRAAPRSHDNKSHFMNIKTRLSKVYKIRDCRVDSLETSLPSLKFDFYG